MGCAFSDVHMLSSLVIASGLLRRKSQQDEQKLKLEVGNLLRGRSFPPGWMLVAGYVHQRFPLEYVACTCVVKLLRVRNSGTGPYSQANKELQHVTTNLIQ